MSEIIFGTQEHIAGLSREALEADFRYVQDRRMELEDACERLQAENAKLRELVKMCWNTVGDYYNGDASNADMQQLKDRMKDLGVEV